MSSTVIQKLCLLCALLLGCAGVGVFAQEPEPTLTVTIHVVQRGEYLTLIAESYATTADVIARLNGLTDPSSIEVGQRLLVPVFNVDAGPASGRHIVRPGESLASIAALYQTTAEQIMVLNNLVDATIYVGLVLNVAAVVPTPLPVAEVPSANGQPASPSIVVHTVVPGETLFRIAQMYGVEVASVVAANSLDNPQMIYPNQTLIIPGVTPPQVVGGLPPVISAFDILPVVLTEGKTARIRIVSTQPVALTGTLLGQSLNFSTADNQNFIGLIGVPVGTQAGIYPAEFSIMDGAGVAYTMSTNVRVTAGGYVLAEDILVTGDSNILLDPGVEQAEENALRSVMSRYNPERYFEGQFGLPAAATITSGFGNSRSYNAGATVRVHLGTDFGGAPGTPILAPAAGRVVLADLLNIRGLATVIDHGWGVYTGYWHQTEQYVRPGDVVQTGQIIGTIGSSGRVSGPHLHWEMWVSGVPVDPMEWTVIAFGA
jgi:murein DD-endopeptidase MepM/ murein hydrolase activator NlpD